MSTVLAIAALVGLFLVFPLLVRERTGRECGTGGCWKKKAGFGCSACPAGRGETATDRQNEPR